MSVKEDVLKEDLLEEAGYRYSLDRMSYINRSAKKVFSIAAVEDHSEDWVREKIAERTDGDWRFYFNEPPTPSVRGQFIDFLEGRHAVR